MSNPRGEECSRLCPYYINGLPQIVFTVDRVGRQITPQCLMLSFVVHPTEAQLKSDGLFFETISSFVLANDVHIIQNKPD